MLVTSCNYAQKLFPRITPQEAEEVKNICDDIKIPSSFTKKDAKFSKDTESAFYSTQYTSMEDSKEIEQYFVKLFTSSGWKYEKESRAYANRLIFKKGKYTVVVEIQNPNFLSSEKIHTVDCLFGLF